MDGKGRGREKTRFAPLFLLGFFDRQREKAFGVSGVETPRVLVVVEQVFPEFPEKFGIGTGRLAPEPVQGAFEGQIFQIVNRRSL